MAGTAGDVAAAAVESASGSGSGSGSRPGVLLRGPGGESCKIGLRPGTARDFFPIVSLSASSRASALWRGGRTGPRCVINIHEPRHRLPRRSASNRRGAVTSRMHPESGRLSGRSAPFTEGWALFREKAIGYFDLRRNR